MKSEISNLKSLETTVRTAVAEATVTDIHTHLFPPSHGGLLLWGIDEMLTYHYLVSELFSVAPRELTIDDFWRMPKERQADLVWEHVFLRHGPISEAARGVLTTLTKLGIDISARSLAPVRKWFAAQRVEDYLPHVLKLAGVDYAVMTNNPFSAEEVPYLTRQLPIPPCLKTALRIDTLLLQPAIAARAMADQGVTADPSAAAPVDLAAARKFLIDWARRIKPLYMAASLPDTFAYGDDSDCTRIIRQAVVPVARELGLPLALMIGVRRGVNPPLRDGGDGVGVAAPIAVQRLCQEFPDVKFLVTMLSRVNQHELCVLGRAFANLHIFGCWWFCNNPSIIDELTRMRLELLGTAFTCQHSDARVLDQLVYKWSHTRAIVADVLVEKYRDLATARWWPTAEEIRRDVRTIFGGSFESFIAK